MRITGKTFTSFSFDVNISIPKITFIKLFNYPGIFKTSKSHIQLDLFCDAENVSLSPPAKIWLNMIITVSRNEADHLCHQQVLENLYQGSGS